MICENPIQSQGVSLSTLRPELPTELVEDLEALDCKTVEETRQQWKFERDIKHQPLQALLDKYEIDRSQFLDSLYDALGILPSFVKRD